MNNYVYSRNIKQIHYKEFDKDLKPSSFEKLCQGLYNYAVSKNDAKVLESLAFVTIPNIEKFSLSDLTVKLKDISNQIIQKSGSKFIELRHNLSKCFNSNELQSSHPRYIISQKILDPNQKSIFKRA